MKLSQMAYLHILRYIKMFKSENMTERKEEIRKVISKLYILYKIIRLREKFQNNSVRAKRLWVKPIFAAE